MTKYLKQFHSYLKSIVRRWAFSDIERANESYRELIKNHVEANADVKALVRDQLQGFDPRHLHQEDFSIFDWVGTESDSENSLLESIHEVAKNDDFRTLLKYLIAHQVVYIARWAKDDKAVNFGRASINGISLVEEEVDRLNTIYLERHTPDEVYDKHEVV